MVSKTVTKCWHCGGTLILSDEDGGHYCLMCRRPYHDFRDFGRLGGQATLARYGQEYMAEIGRRGGLARTLPGLEELKRQQAPKVNEGGWLPNRLSALKELWKERRGESACN